MRALSRRLVLVIADALLLNVGVLLAFFIRFERNPSLILRSEYEGV